jgi:hypothetical protein
MTSKEAKQIAEEYVLTTGEVIPGFRLGIGDQLEFTGKFYFDFIWLTLDGKVPELPPIAGGSRGFTVDKKDKKIELTNHVSLGALKHNEIELSKTYQLFVDFKNGKGGLTEIKAKYKLNSEQLLELSKLVSHTELKKDKIYEIVDALVKKVADRS